MPYYYGIDSTYLLFVLPAILISLWAQMRVKGTFSKYAAVPTRRRMTGAEAAEAVLRAGGVYGVRVERVAGNLTDHYDPKANVIRLSESVYGSSSVAAVGVAAHEAGHAVQYAESYAPIRLRSAIIPVTQFGSYLAWPLILIGFLTSFSALVYAGIILFGLVVLFQLLTLPVEFNASRRAIAALSQGNFLYEEEVPLAKKVLGAAALTYVAAMLVAVAQLLRLLLLAGRSNRRN